MITFDEALALVAGAARPLDAETVPLTEAHGQALAEPVVAQVDVERSVVGRLREYRCDLPQLPRSFSPPTEHQRC